MQVGRWVAGVAAAVLVASGVALSGADGAAAVGDDGQVSSSADGKVAAPAARARAAGATVIGFDDLPVGTTVTDQYRGQGIVFAGGNGAPDPFISSDGASPTSPVLSGSPRFVGAIAGRFVVPGTDRPTGLDTFSLAVGYIDEPGSVGMTVYDAAGATLGVVLADGSGIVTLTSTFPAAARFVVAAAGDEPAGFGIDDVSFTSVRRLAALGDGYASGEGAGAYDPAAGRCHRSALAWPQLLAATPPLSLSADLACSGAGVTALTRPSGGQLQQLAALSPAPDLVTVTLGGTDLGLADILVNCFATDCIASGRLAGAEALLARNLPAALGEAYGRVRAAAPDTEVVVVGYPRLLPAGPAGTTGCGWLTPAEQARFTALTDTLDQVVRTEADDAGLRYVSVLSSLAGHELCTADPWVFPVGLFGAQERGYPLAAGQQAIATTVRTALDGS